MQERLLVVAHGTASERGSATTARLVDAIAATRPNLTVDLCFLDVASPRLSEALDGRPTIALPLLLSTGYHVQSDIPSAVAGHREVRIARHLGPHPLLTEALVERLGRLPDTVGVTLAGASSSSPDATTELERAARLLAARLARPVRPVTITASLRETLAGQHRPVRVATYLLTEGQFVTTLRDAAAGLGDVADPIGVHPALIELAWLRYDEVRVGR